MSKTAVFLADGFEEIEALTVTDLLRREHIETLLVSVSGEKIAKGSHGINVETDTAIGDLDFDSLDMLILPGGKLGTDNLLACKLLEEKIKEFKQEGKYLAAICAAPSVLGLHGVLNGVKACCYPGFEDKLLGAEIVTDKPAVTDGTIITGRGMGCSLEFGLAVVEVLKGREEAVKLSAGIVNMR